MVILLFIIAITLLVFFVFRGCSLNYWKRHHVATLPDSHILFGDIKDVILARENLADIVMRTYNIFKSQGVKYFGIYFMRRPILIPIDPQLIRDIMVKDFEYFVDRGVHIDFDKNQLAVHLFNLNGNEWRNLRQKLSPAFTSGKLKGMMDALNLHTDRLLAKISEKIKPGEDLVLNEFFVQMGIDIIGQVAFGLDINSLNGQNAEFFSMVHRIFHPSFPQLIKHLLFGGVSNPVNVIALTTCDKEMCEFFMSIIKETVAHRKNVMQNNSDDNMENPPKDFLQLLVDLHVKGELSVEEIAGQTFIFFIAAFETSSKALNFTLYELSKNLPLQQKLRDEISSENEQITYDEIMKYKLLDLTFKEGQRRHASANFIHRECAKPYKLSPDTTLEKGQILLMPINAMHADPEHFPEPDVFDPMRFDDVESVYKKIDPLTYYPFGAGPRNCIGMRFGVLQVKLALAKIIKNFELRASPKTVEPFRFKPVTDNLLLTYEDPVYFRCRKL